MTVVRGVMEMKSMWQEEEMENIASLNTYSHTS